MNVNIRDVSKKSVIAMIAVSVIAMLLLSLGPAGALPNVGSGTVMGTVTDINDGEPIEGAQVTISYHGIVRTDITDASGAYKFTNVPECFCLKTVEVTKDGYRPESEDVGVSGITVVDFELMIEELEPYMGTIMGSVTDSHDGEPLEGARVELEYHGTTRTVFTDAEGEYRFDRVPECFCLKNITVTKEAYRPETAQVGVHGITVVDFELMHEEMEPPKGSVRGIVTDADTDLPIKGAEVTLGYHDIVRTTITNADGLYVFTDVPICYCMKDLSVEADGYIGEERQVAVGEETVEDFALEPDDGGSTGFYGTISGIVTDADTGLPIAGAEVTLEYHDVVRTAITNADGLYVFTDVPICFCMKDLSVEADGYEGRSMQVAVSEQTVQDIALEPGDDGSSAQPGVWPGVMKGRDQPILSREGIVAIAGLLGVSAALGLVLFLVISTRRRDRIDE